MSPITVLKRRHLVAACLFALFALVVAMLSPAVTSAANAAPRSNVKHVYIVMTTQQPLASYTGGVRGIRATKPARGAVFHSRTANARAYKSFLVNRHNAALRRIGVPRSAKQLDYTVAFNGFAAKLTAAQAARLAKTPGVGFVWKNEIRHADTVSTPKFLGLDGPGGAWQTQFGGPADAGRGIIVGDIDTGFWPENPAFASLSSTPDQATINSKWHGTCVTGNDPTPANDVTCNNKVIGARYYTTDNTINSFEFLSPRDYNGHGSHTASTAAGDHGVPASINGVALGDMSGMAPAARIAVYKALWAKPDGTASGSTTGLVKAIDDAVNDGVDVINYSISGSTQYIVSPDEIAFLGAADAGVFVSTSAGNDGPGASTVAHDSPWEMTVAASTHDRGTRNTVKLGNGTSYPGIGVSDTGVGPAPLVNSPDAAAAGASADAARLCFSKATNGGTAALDPAKVAGKIVICYPGHERPGRQEPGRPGGRRRRDGARQQQRRRVPERRLPLGPDQPRQRHERRRDQGVRRLDDQPHGDHHPARPHARPGPRDGGLLLGGTGHGRGRRPAEAGHHGPRRRRDRGRVPGRKRREQLR